MKIDLHRAYVNPQAIVRVENVDSGVKAGLEIITQVHDLTEDPNASLESPSYIRHHLHKEKKGEASILESIRVTVEFDDPAHVLRASYVKWSQTEMDHPICQGNGRVANQSLPDKTQVKTICLGPSRCPIANAGGTQCLIDVRLNAVLDKTPIEIRSNSQNGFLAMLSGLEYAKARAGGVLSSALLDVTVWEKSTRGSKYQRFSTIDIRYGGCVEGGLPSTVAMNAYGDKLLADWESKFEVPGEAMVALALPTEHAFEVSKHAESHVKTIPKNAELAAVFNVEALTGKWHHQTAVTA